MKKLVICFLAAMLLLSGCSNNGGGKEEEKPEKKQAVAYFCRTLGDFGFNDNGWQGTKKAAEKYGMEAQAIELGDDTATFENALVEACDSGKYTMIVTQNGSGLGDYVRKHSVDYPDIKFIVFDMGLTEDPNLPKNVYGIAYRASEACFLAGALAAKISENKKVAILSNDNPGGNDFAAGFVSGAKYADPDVQVYYYYGMADAAAWQEQASSLYQMGVNVILAGSGRFALGVFNEAYNRGGTEKGNYVIGIDTDMWYTLTQTESVDIAQVIVSSATKELAYTIEDAIDRDQKGTLPWGTLESSGIKEGGANVAINDNYKALTTTEVQDYMSDLIKKVTSGEVKPTSFYDFASQEAFLAWLRPLIGD